MTRDKSKCSFSKGAQEVDGLSSAYAVQLLKAHKLSLILKQS